MRPNRSTLLAIIACILCAARSFADTSPTQWMRDAQYGVFLHYQYRILLGYSVRTYGGNEQACLVKGLDDFTAGDTWIRQDLTRLIPARLPAQRGILWHGKIYCGNIYHGQGDANQFADQELIDWINTCNRQGGVCTLDWPFDPKTGLLKDFGFEQLRRIARAVKGK